MPDINFKIHFTCLIILVNCTLFSQTFQTPPDSLIRKHRVKKIISYTLDSTNIEQQHFIYQYDSAGSVTSYQWFEGGRGDPDENINIVRYWYQSKLLQKSVYVKSGRDAQIDTTIYFYDRQERLLKKSSKKYYHFNSGYDLLWNRISRHKYLTDTTVIVVEEETNWWRKTKKDTKIRYDTMIYNHDRLLHHEISQIRGEKTFFIYNKENQLLSKTIIRNDSALRRDTFYYEKGRLVREENYFESTKSNSKYTESASMNFLYNDNGLLAIVKRPVYSIIYRYEFY